MPKNEGSTLLSDAACRTAKPGEKPKKLSDSGGLYLLILPSGGKSWRLAYRFAGKQKAISFGKYPAVSLAEARGKRDDAKRKLEAGLDPADAERAETFEEVARRWHDINKASWVPEHAERVLSRIERDVFPQIGHRLVTEIRPPDILALLRKVEERGALDISRRLKQSISAVFRLAIAEGKAEVNPAADVGEALRPKPKVEHFARLKADGIPQLMRDIHGYDGEDQTRLALLLALHTFVRTKELRFGEWREFEGLDGREPLWRIPKERMKMGREHLVPLTPTVVKVLRDLKALAGDSEFVLPSRTKTGTVSENTLLFALYRMGYHSRLTVHGFRGMASTILNEEGFNRDWVELQLAHSEEDEVRGAYNAALYLPGRRKMMLFWSDFLTK